MQYVPPLPGQRSPTARVIAIEPQAPGAEEAARAAVYGLLSRLLLRAPDAALLDALSTLRESRPGGAAAGEAAPLQAAARALGEAAGGMPAAAVADEYAALFEAVAAPLVDPYGSRYIAGFLMEKPLAALRSDLARIGLERAARAGVSEDHLGAVLEAMHLLAGGQPDFPARPLALQRGFFVRHLEPWADACLEEIAAARPARFYRAVARFAQAFLAVERGAFERLGDDEADEPWPAGPAHPVACGDPA